MSYLAKKIIIFLILLHVNSLYPNQFEEIIEKTFSNRKLDTLEGLWEKTYANQGSTGCITMFYKIEKDLFNQTSIKVKMQFTITIEMLHGSLLLLRSQKI